MYSDCKEFAALATDTWCSVELKESFCRKAFPANQTLQLRRYSHHGEEGENVFRRLLIQVSSCSLRQYSMTVVCVVTAGHQQHFFLYLFRLCVSQDLLHQLLPLQIFIGMLFVCSIIEHQR